MLKAHGCRKCHGTLLLDKDEFGWYEECIQCGYTRDIPLEVLSNTRLRTEPIPVAVITDARDLVERWKRDDLPSFRPIGNLGSREEDTY